MDGIYLYGKLPNAAYMDAPGGARVCEVMSNVEWTARL